MERSKLEFGELLEIVDCLQHNQVFDFNYFNPSKPFTVEFIETTFQNANELISWLKQNPIEVKRVKRIRSVDYLLQEEYYESRIKGTDELFLVMKEDDAILMRIKVSNSVKINSSTFELYKSEIMLNVLQHN